MICLASGFGLAMQLTSGCVCVVYAEKEFSSAPLKGSRCTAILSLVISNATANEMGMFLLTGFQWETSGVVELLFTMQALLN